MKYTALTPIKHNGTDYAEGEAIVLEGKDAEVLLASGAVEAESGKGKAKDGGGADSAKAGK